MLADNADAAIGSALILLLLLALVALWAWVLVDTLRAPDDNGRPWRVVAYAMEEQAEALIRLESTPARRPLSGHAQRVATGHGVDMAVRRPPGGRHATVTQRPTTPAALLRTVECVQRSPSERR
jgi:hypothetical protein